MVDEVAGAAGISYVLTIKCCLMTWTCLMLPSTVFHVSWYKNMTIT
jgi:hypothetical protein